jgi:hypothetical protein
VTYLTEEQMGEKMDKDFAEISFGDGKIHYFDLVLLEKSSEQEIEYEIRDMQKMVGAHKKFMVIDKSDENKEYNENCILTLQTAIKWLQIYKREHHKEKECDKNCSGIHVMNKCILKDDN